MLIDSHLSITGLGALSALGTDVSSHHAAVNGKHVPFRSLGELLGNDSPHAARPGAWIENRAMLTHRKWSPVTMAALHVARQAITDAGWSADQLRDAALVVGTSRGNAAGWLGPWPGRRPFKLMSASNTIHSEPASAITIEFGITGPNHVLASGCAAGLDAIGIAMMLVKCGAAPRALAVAVDLPLVPLLLDNYAASGILTKQPRLDPYHPAASGFVPAEGAAAMAIEALSGNHPRLLHYGCNSDACDPVGIPKNGGRTPDLFAASPIRPAAVCPHATGTAVQAAADPAALVSSFPDNKPTLHLLKPFLGHTIGASGMLESVVLAAFLRDGKLPPNLSGLHAPAGFELPEETGAATGAVAKLSHGMGGHNALLILSRSMNETRRLVVSIDDQTLRVIAGGICLREFPVSTSSLGTGFVKDSYRTPTGNFRICEKIGAAQPCGTIFKARVAVGQWQSGESPDEDLILTRILRLDGLDFDNSNTLERCIYIHGTNREDLVGQPAGHGCVRLRNDDMIELFDMVCESDHLEILAATSHSEMA